ncbi:g13117 [Coccomyxa viridis]|uniref:G13117 protein n=1 Tax=Coccomyxa viridis TaxID=1274662 RepID=A0ABP1GCC3_9CHLO
MSTTTAQAARDQDAGTATDATENDSPNCTKVGLKSVMKTASKPLRVPADIDESSPTPVRVLRNGKKIRATPRLPKASRVTLSPEDTKAFGGAHRVPFAQVNPVTPPTQPGTALKKAMSPSSGDQQLSIVTPQDMLSKDAPSTPTPVISSMQQLQLAESTPESLLLCQELLADSSSGTLEAPEGATAAELSPMQPPTPSDIQADGDALESPTAADMPAGSQAAASVSTPQHNAGAAAGNCSAETPTMPFPPFGGRGDALISVSTPEHGPGPQSEEGPSVQTPVPAEGASEAGGPASARVKTPVPGPSPQLPGQPDLITPPPQILGNMETPDLDASHHMQQDTPDEAPEAFMQQETTAEKGETLEVGGSFIPRGKRTPFMERKLRALQAKDWADPDAGKVHKSRLEREKEAAAAARKDSLSSADKAATRRLVRSTIAKAVDTEGRDLGETMVRHKSRLEREKEAAEAQKDSGLPGSVGQAKQRRSPAGSSFAGQGLGDMKTHMSRLEKDRATAAAKKAAGISSPAVESRLPSYMRQTAASVAMQKEGGLGENMKVHKSQLEKDREKALALQAARKKAGHNPLTPYPVKRAGVAKPRLSFGSLGAGPAHRSKLEKAKEAATAAAAAASDAAAPTTRPPKPTASSRAAAAPGAGLGDMKPHKSRLEREKEAWTRQASAEGAAKPSSAAGSTVLQAHNTNIAPVTSARKPVSKEGAGREEGFSEFVPN